MAKKKLNTSVPESLCLFNAKEVEYITLTAKSIPYRVDVQTATINVPHDHFELANENLHIRHLINKFAFVVQATIGAEYTPTKEFKPELRSVQVKEITDVRMPLRSEVWLNAGKKERIYIKAVDDKHYTFTFLNDMRGDKKYSVAEVRKMVSDGELKPE
jgi:hypothetical protein